jgi:hypothetical protein
MARTLRKIATPEGDALRDLLGGVWLVALMLGLLHLPALVL